MQRTDHDMHWRQLCHSEDAKQSEAVKPSWALSCVQDVGDNTDENKNALFQEIKCSMQLQPLYFTYKIQVLTFVSQDFNLDSIKYAV